MCASLGPKFWDSLSFLDFLEVWFLCQIGEVLLHYLFKEVFNFLLFLFSFWHPYNSDVGTLKDVLEVPKPLLIFLNSCFFVLFWLDVSFFWSIPLIWVWVSFPSLLVPCTFSFISLRTAFIFSSSFRPNSTNSVSVLITSVLNCASDRLAISSLLSCIFYGDFICSSIWAILFLSLCGC